MEWFGRMTVVGLLLVLMIMSCAALKCFDCDSLSRPQGCGDHFALPNTAAADCQGTCIKRRGERYSNQVRLVEVYRTCVQQTGEGCYDTSWNGISVKACTCNRDYCNTGVRTLSHPLGVAVQLLVALAAGIVGRWMFV